MGIACDSTNTHVISAGVRGDIKVSITCSFLCNQPILTWDISEESLDLSKFMKVPFVKCIVL